MLRVIGWGLFVIVVVFTSVQANSNNRMLEEQAKQLAALQLVCTGGVAKRRSKATERAITKERARRAKYEALTERASQVRSAEERAELVKELERIRRGD